MWNDFNFLFEIGSEEIPAGYLPDAIKNFETFFRNKFAQERITFDDIKVYATPRRIVTAISNLAESQKEETIELKGPSVDKAYGDDGKPSRALEGFMRGNGISEADLVERETPKGNYIFAEKEAETSKTEEIIPAIIKECIEKSLFPKKMKWSSKSLVYPRPIRYILLLLNNKVVPFEIEGISASNKTRGHYVKNQDLMEVAAIADYEEQLKKHDVTLNQTDRKEYIREELGKAAAAVDCQLVEDEELLDTVTYIAEDPNIVTCEFKPSFLEIPAIVLITEMREHQKYFALRKNDGSLSNKFLVISNIPATSFIKEGNERVVTARFDDANFFFTEDRKAPLFNKIDSLKSVLFHKELGSIYDKVERMIEIGNHISTALGYDDGLVDKIKRATLLSKADLNTAMVYEFTSLQGKMGAIYANLDGEDPQVAAAIEDHYRPRFQGDALPESEISIVLSLSEKLDNIFGSYSVGNIPKGSQDPYALRRQAHAIVDIIIKNNIKVNLEDIFNKVSNLYKDGESLVKSILDFINGRAKTIFQDADFKYDEVDSVMSTGNTDYYELFLRAQSINEFRNDENFKQMLLGFKRMNNILSAFYKKNKDYSVSFKSENLKEDAEKELCNFFSDKKSDINSYIENNNYKELFSVLIDGKSAIDNFFDKVMVMVDDIAIRDNRVALLEDILNPFRNLIDFSKLSE